MAWCRRITRLLITPPLIRQPTNHYQPATTDHLLVLASLSNNTRLTTRQGFTVHRSHFAKFIFVILLRLCLLPVMHICYLVPASLIPPVPHTLLLLIHDHKMVHEVMVVVVW